MDPAIRAIQAIVASVLGLAILSVIISRSANTSGVISSAGNALASIISAATSPVSGGQSIGAINGMDLNGGVNFANGGIGLNSLALNAGLGLGAGLLNGFGGFNFGGGTGAIDSGVWDTGAGFGAIPAGVGGDTFT